MFSDNTLTPKEAIRLCALGTLVEQPMRYGALAMSVRHFVSRVLGPSLEVMGGNIELLKYEGLIEAADEKDPADDPLLTVTDAGREVLRVLLVANIRAAATELNKLIVALKFRFLHILGAEERRTQADILIEAGESELARLEDLRAGEMAGEGYLARWLDHDLELLRARLEWLKALRQEL